MNQQIEHYYEALASSYDSQRFDNSYGAFLHKQEKQILDMMLCSRKQNMVLDLGCGTGRFLEYARIGLDISKKMLAVSKLKHPVKQLVHAPAQRMPFDNNVFDSIFSFHLFMHLRKNEIVSILKEVYRVLKPGGYFIFDIPSGLRRRITGYKASSSWHCAASFTLSEIKSMLFKGVTFREYYGLLFFPLHRFGDKSRKRLFFLDTFLNGTILKYFSSYYVVVINKNRQTGEKR